MYGKANKYDISIKQNIYVLNMNAERNKIEDAEEKYIAVRFSK